MADKTKDENLPAPQGERSNFLIEEEANGITVGMLQKALDKLDPNIQVLLSVGPDYDEIPITSVLAVPSYGALFFVGEQSDEDDDEDDDSSVATDADVANASCVIEGEYTILDKEEPIPDGAEAA